jgi:hypothetical protein
LSFEWILLITILVIGIVGGIAAVRDAILDEFKDMSQAVSNLTMFDDEDPDEDCPEICRPGDFYCIELP